MKRCRNKVGFPRRACGKKAVVELRCSYQKISVFACVDCQHDWAYCHEVTQYSGAGYLKVKDLV